MSLSATSETVVKGRSLSTVATINGGIQTVYLTVGRLRGGVSISWSANPNHKLVFWSERHNHNLHLLHRAKRNIHPGLYRDRRRWKFGEFQPYVHDCISRLGQSSRYCSWVGSLATRPSMQLGGACTRPLGRGQIPKSWMTKVMPCIGKP